MLRNKFLITIASLSVSVFVLFSCSNNLIEIASDVPDMAYVAEAYNEKFPSRQAIVYESDDLLRAIEEKNIAYVISYIDSENNRNALQNFSFAKQSINNTIIRAQKNNFSVLGFSLPLIVIRKDQFRGDIKGSQVTLDELQDLSTKYFVEDKDARYTLGFYPIDDSFIDAFSDKNSYAQWIIQAGIDNEDINIYYENHYGPASITSKLLDKGILYKYISSKNFLKLDEDVREQFSIFLLTDAENMIPHVTPIYIGLLSKKNISHAEKNFMDWIFSEDGQEDIVEYIRKNKRYFIKPPFIDNNFSSIWDINSKYLFSSDYWIRENFPSSNQIK